MHLIGYEDYQDRIEELAAPEKSAGTFQTWASFSNRVEQSHI